MALLDELHAVHPREPYISQREKFVSPFYEREKELGGYFDNEVACWERAFAYESNREKLAEYLKDIPVRKNEWDQRHVPYELSNAEHLAMSDSVGMINLSHFPIMDIEGPDAEKMLEYLSVAKIGGNTPIGKVIYTNFLDEDGGVHADLTISRLAENKYRIVTGGADGNRDWVLLRNYRDDNSLDVSINIRTHDIATLGLWGPEAEAALGNFVDPNAINLENFPFVTAKNLTLNLSEGNTIDVWAAAQTSIVFPSERFKVKFFAVTKGKFSRLIAFGSTKLPNAASASGPQRPRVAIS